MEELDMKDLLYKDNSGNIIKDPQAYFSSQNTDNFIEEEIEVGTVVKLKNFDDKIEILYKNYEIPNLGIVDYAGKNLDNESDDLILFNQKDIESIKEKGKHNGR